MSSLSLSFLTCSILSTVPVPYLDAWPNYQLVLRLKSWVVLLCNKWSTPSSPAGSLNVLSRKCNKTALSTFQSSPRRRKNYPYSPLLLHRQGRAAQLKALFLSMEVLRQVIIISMVSRSFYKTVTPALDECALPKGWVGSLTCSCCTTTLRSGHWQGQGQTHLKIGTLGLGGFGRLAREWLDEAATRDLGAWVSLLKWWMDLPRTFRKLLFVVFCFFCNCMQHSFSAFFSHYQWGN